MLAGTAGAENGRTGKDMLRYIVRRLFQSILLLFLLSIAFFALLHLIPGGPDTAIGADNPTITLEQRAAIRHAYGLDQPLPVQYLSWLSTALRGNLGYSITNGRPVIVEIADRLPATLELFLTALSFALIVATVLGVISAVKQYSLTDYVITVIAYAGISMPVFWFGLVLQEIFGVQLHLLPVYGRYTLGLENADPFTIFIDYALHLILPAFVLSFLFIATWSRFLRSSMLEVINQDYIRTAKAKGLGPRTIFFRHGLRNALIPMVTVVALSFGGIVGGAVVTEQVFAWPGMGTLFFFALPLPDYPILMGFLILGASSVIFFGILADILYAVVDPRIRYT
jgi:peptide/nickel transport system permease protein